MHEDGMPSQFSIFEKGGIPYEENTTPSTVVPLGSIGFVPVHTHWGKWHAANQCHVFWRCAMASLQIAYID